MTALIVSCSNAQEEKPQETQQESAQDQRVTLVDKTAFKELMNNEAAQLVDVRTPREVANGKIGNAKNINFHDSDFRDQIAQLDKDKPVLVYCAAGGRSSKAVSMMKEMGFQEIHELKGGYNAWAE